MSEAKSSVTSTEFIKWQVVYEEEQKETTKEHHYFAQLTHQVYLLRLAWSTANTKTILRQDDFLLKFELSNKTKKKESQANDKEDPEKVRKARQQYLQASKAAWFAATGIDKGDKFPVRALPKK